MLVCLAFLAGCTPWLADPSESTEVELAANLSDAQEAAVQAAVEEINAAVGREVFHVRGKNFGRRGKVTVTADKPRAGLDAETIAKQARATIKLGAETDVPLIAHELLHTILGGGHSDDPADVFHDPVRRDAIVTDSTVERIEARMGGAL